LSWRASPRCFRIRLAARSTSPASVPPKCSFDRLQWDPIRERIYRLGPRSEHPDQCVHRVTAK
jgi:hypothetical protein